MTNSANSSSRDHAPSIGSTLDGEYPLAAVRIVARACYEAQWDEEGFDRLNIAGIEYALAMQVGRAALDAVRFLGAIHAAERAQPCTCSPDEAPRPCAKRYALTECLAVASERSEELSPRQVDVARSRDEIFITHTDLTTLITSEVLDSLKEEDWRPEYTINAIVSMLVEKGIVSVRRSPEQIAQVAHQLTALNPQGTP